MFNEQMKRDIMKAVKEQQDITKINKLMRKISIALNDENYLNGLNLKYVGTTPIDEVFFTFVNEAKLLNEHNFDKVLESFTDHLRDGKLVAVLEDNKEI